MTIRVAPPANASKGPNNITVNADYRGQGGGGQGRTYNVAVGSTADVPDHDAVQLEAQGWHRLGEFVSTTAGRPAAGIAKGKFGIDTTLGAVIVYDGTQWRNAITGAVV